MNTSEGGRHCDQAEHGEQVELTQLVQVEMTMMMMKDGLCRVELWFVVGSKLVPVHPGGDRGSARVEDSVTRLRAPRWADC